MRMQYNQHHWETHKHCVRRESYIHIMGAFSNGRIGNDDRDDP